MVVTKAIHGRWAEISQCEKYRYLLDIHLDPPRPRLLGEERTLVVCMLNPSIADATRDDATVRWLIGWARKWGYTKIRIVNLAAYRATDQKDLFAATDPHGPRNAEYLALYASCCDVVCAWGTGGRKLLDYEGMLSRICRVSGRLLCFGTNKDGSPYHPLRRSHDSQLRNWEQLNAR